MTVEEARRDGVCRVCGKSINVPPGQPKDWKSRFGEMVYPLAVTLNFGDEFAHTACLNGQAVSVQTLQVDRRPEA